LDRLRVFSYPGRGEHVVMVEFAANHAPEGHDVEAVRFSQRFRVQEGSAAGIIGYPVFKGLRVGRDGLAFKVYTVNVMNTADESALSFMDADSFKSGLALLNAANPTLAPISELAKGLTRMLLSSKRGVPVQDVHIGLDFENSPLGARLTLGSYLAIQVKDAASWSFSNVFLDRRTGQVVQVLDQEKSAIPFNYFAFSIQQFS
jgi:hypothetical protein